MIVKVLVMLLCALMFAGETVAQNKPNKPRARDLGVPFDGTPGRLNAITDVEGVEVGLVTLISGDGKLTVGKGPVRTGVTAILPRGKNSPDQVFPLDRVSMMSRACSLVSVAGVSSKIFLPIASCIVQP